MLNGGYERLIAKPPHKLNEWPLSKVIEFKNSLYEANTAYARLKAGQNYSASFFRNANRILQFYQEKSQNAD
ncbi:hypothetical protein C7N83_01010 [Neisseria iguanae]|uniref:Uncharacterized protein n=2 Tax=Neisseria iguanae TaxID=90242 RepID=A0A2P7U2T0_9NEIS|nr:hypothetical protein C7N83_01010 [Neisseria iguanae]